MGGYVTCKCTCCTCIPNCLSTNHTGPLPPQPPLRPVKHKSTVLTDPVSRCDFLNHVAVRILGKWMIFGIHLEIPVTELNTYPSHDVKVCFACVFASWERKGSPDLSWGTVIDILERPIIDERQLAEEIKEKMVPSTFSPSHTLL